MSFSRNLSNRLARALTSVKAATEFTTIYDVSTAGVVQAGKALIADSSKDVDGIRNLSLGTTGSTLGSLKIDGNTSGTVTVTVAAAAGTWTMTLPTAAGSNGEQLTTNGSGVTSWGAAGSMRAFKNVLGDISGQAAAALQRLVDASVYEFTYRSDDPQAVTTQDFDTHYRGVMADELPEVMHFDGKIFNPVSAFGMAVLAIKALKAEVDSLKAQLAAA